MEKRALWFAHHYFCFPAHRLHGCKRKCYRESRNENKPFFGRYFLSALHHALSFHIPLYGVDRPSPGIVAGKWCKCIVDTDSCFRWRITWCHYGSVRLRQILWYSCTEVAYKKIHACPFKMIQLFWRKSCPLMPLQWLSFVLMEYSIKILDFQFLNWFFPIQLQKTFQEVVSR